MLNQDTRNSEAERQARELGGYKSTAVEASQDSVEDSVQAALSGKTSDPKELMAAFQHLCWAGRDAEAVRIVTIYPKVLANTMMIVLAIGAAAGSGWPELANKLKLFETAAKSWDQYWPLIGPGLVRCAHQLAHRGDETEALRLFVSTSLTRISLSEFVSYNPVLITTHVRLFGIDETRKIIRQIADEKGITDQNWVDITLARYQPGRFPDAVDTDHNTWRDRYFPKSKLVCYAGTGGFHESLTAKDEAGATAEGLTLPKLTLEQMAKGMRQVRDLAANFAPDVLAPYRHLLGSGDGPSPILILSTGRSGTQSVNDLLEKSQTFAPFHSLNIVPEPGDLNRLMHRILRGDNNASDIRHALERLARDRLVEVFGSWRQGRRPVFANHLDMVQIPLYLALFPDMQVVHIHRDPALTLISHAYKMQFRYQQIRPLYAREDLSSGQFLYARPKDLSLEQNVVWFQVATELAAETARGLVRSGEYHDIDMDPVFRGDPAAIDAFIHAFPDPTFSRESVTEHFSVPINAKTHYEVPEALKSKRRAQDLYERYRTQLLETGEVK